MMKMEYHIGRSGKMIKKIKEWFKAEDMLPNGCLPSGHKFAPHGMCLICGEYEDSSMIQRGYSYKDEQIKGRDNV